jgi:hypothetical protein
VFNEITVEHASMQYKILSTEKQADITPYVLFEKPQTSRTMQSPKKLLQKSRGMIRDKTQYHYTGKSMVIPSWHLRYEYH